MSETMTEPRGYKVEISDCEWLYVHADDPESAADIAWNEYTAATCVTREDVIDESGSCGGVKSVLALDGGALTLRRLVDLKLCNPLSVADCSDATLDRPERAILITTEW